MNLKRIAALLLLAYCAPITVSQGRAQTLRVPTLHVRKPIIGIDKNKKTAGRSNCWLLPTLGSCLPTERQPRIDAINNFFDTSNSLSYFNQIKSIYNGASGATTLSSDLASLNFLPGIQITATTNLQVGPLNQPPVIAAGGIPTLSSSGAGQAAQNMLYGGNLVVSATYPLIYFSSGKQDDPGNFGVTVNFLGRGGVDIQNFQAGTSASATAPPSHSDAQIQGYLQYNSTNSDPTTKKIMGALFFGGSYGYNYTSHGYARGYGFGNNVNNRIGQISAGVLVTSVARITISKAWGPSQTFIDSGTLALRTTNNFKAWSIGIAYQSPSPAQQ